jgi:type I restriction enzyme S subunit
MNAERLLANYERIADTSDAIPRLRRFVLNLAVRGKLGPQDPNDEPATELLKRIAKEKAELVKEGKAKRREPLPEPDLNHAPFILPVGWTWGRFPELGTFGRGKSKHRPRNDSALFDGGTHLMIQTGDVARSQGVIDTYTSKYNDFGLSQSFKWPKGTLCITIAANIADGGILSFDACFPDSVVGFIPASMFENARYFEYFVRTAKADLLEFAPATAQKNINLEILTQILIPLPPLAEQRRIVAKVRELMALCDRLEAARAEREATRDRLTAASLARLSAPDPDTFRDDVRFTLDTLPLLTARADQIKQLRQTILNFAVRGTLVPQDPNDEPASELLKRLSKEFGKLVEDGVLNKPKPLKPISNSEHLFPLPSGWALARFNQIASIQSNLVDPKRYKDMPHIAPDNIESWTARLLPYVTVGEAGVFSGKHLFSAGAILYSKIRPNLAKVTKVDFDGLCSADMYPIHALVDRDFLMKFMITQDFVSQAVSEDNRVAMPKINQAALSDILVPVPPLAEQRRIVAKVDELMALCDRLEMKLTTADETRRRLLDALLAEALAPNEERKLEAAE